MNEQFLGSHLDTQRFWDDVTELGTVGAIEPKGIRRLALDDEDNQARLWLADQVTNLGCSAHYDALGNIFIRREGQDPELAPLLIGSHLDSQPCAGKHDGALGVVAGLAVLQTFVEQGIDHARALEIVAWTNEEGARFAPGASGSSWFANRRAYEAIASAVDKEGVRFGDALGERLSLMARQRLAYREAPFVPHAFVELHIEQGSKLEALGMPVGIVSGIQGVHWYRIDIHGQANHAGTTSPTARRDAFDGAHELISALKTEVRQQDGDLRFTIGKFSVWPDSVNTIPQQARFTVDLRHPSQSVLDLLNERFHALAKRQWAGCDVSLTVLSRVAPVSFDDSVLAILRDCTSHCCDQVPEFVSGAFHDAIHLAHACPTAMLFTPCRAGISHHPDEHIERADAEIATRVLVSAAARLLDTSLSCSSSTSKIALYP
jgi:N-carbamoyl-L-amino-acid hydrolase